MSSLGELTARQRAGWAGARGRETPWEGRLRMPMKLRSAGLQTPKGQRSPAVANSFVGIGDAPSECSDSFVENSSSNAGSSRKVVEI